MSFHQSSELRLNLLCLFLVCVLPGMAQSKSPGGSEGRLIGPDAPENRSVDIHHLAGGWDGYRERLSEKGLSFDLLYVSDSLDNLRSPEAERFTSFSRVRGTVDLDLAKLAHLSGLTLHATGVWQTGANLGNYLGSIASPSALSTSNAFRLDAWWLEQRFASKRIAVRFGQFAGLDSYGAQHYGGSFVAQPIGYALTALGNTYTTYQPFATPAAEVRVAPFNHLYVKSMVLSGDPSAPQHNLTGFVPQFRGSPVSLSEVGWTPGRRASDIQTDTVSDRRGYSGLYQFGAAFNPGKFDSAQSSKPVSGNYTLYAMGSQAIWRDSQDSGVGPDFTAAASWGPSDRNRDNAQLTLGLRYNELLPIHCHNTVSLGYVRSGISSQFPVTPRLSPQSAENLVELNTLIGLPHGLVVQPVLQRFFDLGATSKSSTLLGFRAKVTF